MKIILINPPFEDEYSVGDSASFKHVLNIISPLGLAYLAAVLQEDKIHTRIFDFTVAGQNESIFKAIIEEEPDIIGITASTPVFPSARLIAEKIRIMIPKAVIILGGAHVTAMPHQAMEAGCFDAGVIGEAEETLLELAKHIEINGLSKLCSIKGIIYRENGEFHITGRREFIKDIDTIPYPARHLLPPLSFYKPTPASYKRLPLGVMMTSRGCPQQCTFCDRSVFGNTYRQRSTNNVLGEVDELIHKYGAREIRFFDDCFTLNKERTLEICAGLKKRRIPWTCLTTVTNVTKDLLTQMKSAGCWQVLFGLESADESMLKALKKGATLEQNITAVRWAKQAGLSVRADFIVGTPGETESSIEKTLDFALRMKLDYAHFNKFVPYPGTELYSRLKAQGHDFDFTKGASITDNLHFMYIPKDIKDKHKYVNIINSAHKKFYLRPGYILGRLLSIRTWDEFRGQLKGFLSIFLLSNQ
jgi:radical SAM superfamily enzyme YgiQ (UPF0313 family)